MAIWVNADEMVERLKWDFNEEYAKSILDDVTSFCADMVEVVRCKDCKHFGGYGACYCHAADENGTPIFVRENDFCSYGERKENEN